jgi:hypothetical protein
MQHLVRCSGLLGSTEFTGPRQPEGGSARKRALSHRSDAAGTDIARQRRIRKHLRSRQSIGNGSTGAPVLRERIHRAKRHATHDLPGSVPRPPEPRSYCLPGLTGQSAPITPPTTAPERANTGVMNTPVLSPPPPVQYNVQSHTALPATAPIPAPMRECLTRTDGKPELSGIGNVCTSSTEGPRVGASVSVTET